MLPSAQSLTIAESGNLLSSILLILLVDELDEIDVDTSDYKSNQAPSWNAPGYNYPNQMDESLMEREDMRAELVAETAIRGAESLVASRKGILQTQSSLFNDQESVDSDDDVTDTVTSKMDRKTMHQILRQHSGQDLQSEEVVAEKSNTSNLRNSIGNEIIGGEPDCEEEFVFQYVVLFDLSYWS